MNFGSYDLKYNPKDLEKKQVSKEHELCENGSPPKALETSSEKAAEAERASCEKAAEAAKVEEKHEMSLPRKIAFGFSFLPSVMFVLAFAVILPCEDYKPTENICVKNEWLLLWNQTEITCQFSLPQSLLLGYHFANSTDVSGGVVNLDPETGKPIWNLSLNSYPKKFRCRALDANQDGIQDCLTTLDNGNIYVFNLSNGHVFWNSSVPNAASVLLPGCSPPRIAVANYINEDILVIDVLNETDGSVLASKKVQLNSKCLNFSMKSWEHRDVTDFVFLCKGIEGQGHISLVKRSLWCSPEIDNSEIDPKLLTRFGADETEVTYHPTNEGLLVWTDAKVTYFNSDGDEKWELNTRYVPQNRIIQFGYFYTGGEQVALIGQNASSGIVVSILTSEEGRELRTLSIADRNLNQAFFLPGNESDAFLLLVSKEKVTETEKLSDNEVTILSNVSSTSKDFRTDAPYQLNGKRSLLEEIILFQFGGKNTTHVILSNEIPHPCDNGGICESEYPASRIISAFSEQKENSVDLKIVMLKSQDNKNSSRHDSQLTALNIVHTDSTPVTGQSTCAL